MKNLSYFNSYKQCRVSENAGFHGRDYRDDCHLGYCAVKKGKSVPKHIYGGAGGRGDIAPTHSRPRH
jgi:hypothetical protein